MHKASNVASNFMINFKALPVRQKVLIGLTVIIGLILIACSALSIVNRDTLNQMVIYYSIGVPIFLLMTDNLIDLNDKNIFRIWLTIAFVMFIVSLITYNSECFIIRRSSIFDKATVISSLIINRSTSALKSLILFLGAYWLLNKMLKTKGIYIINTYRQSSWYNNIAQREISGLDVFINFLLLIIIIISSLLQF